MNKWETPLTVRSDTQLTHLWLVEYNTPVCLQVSAGDDDDGTRWGSNCNNSRCGDHFTALLHSQDWGRTSGCVLQVLYYSTDLLSLLGRISETKAVTFHEMDKRTCDNHKQILFICSMLIKIHWQSVFFPHSFVYSSFHGIQKNYNLFAYL